jgi:hypothetical protein
MKLDTASSSCNSGGTIARPPLQFVEPIQTHEKALQVRHKNIQEAAYQRLEQHDIAPGCELDDWLAAESVLNSAHAGSFF